MAAAVAIFFRQSAGAHTGRSIKRSGVWGYARPVSSKVARDRVVKASKVKTALGGNAFVPRHSKLPNHNECCAVTGLQYVAQQRILKDVLLTCNFREGGDLRA